MTDLTRLHCNTTTQQHNNKPLQQILLTACAGSEPEQKLHCGLWELAAFATCIHEWKCPLLTRTTYETISLWLLCFISFFSVFTCISLFILICINKTVCFLCKMRMLRAIRREKEQKKRCIGMDGHTDHDANRANTSSLSLSISVKLCINLIYFNSIMAFVFILFLSTSRIWCVPSIFFYLCIYLMLLLSLSSFVFTCQSVASLLSCAHKLQYVCIGQEEVWHRRHINI